jgi:hypothetical protein
MRLGVAKSATEKILQSVPEVHGTTPKGVIAAPSRVSSVRNGREEVDVSTFRLEHEMLAYDAKDQR